MARRYSADPAEAFFTGGGVHRFRNFRPEEDARMPSVREAFEHSINLAFVRLLRDVVDYHGAAAVDARAVLEQPSHPARREYLERFADREGRRFLAEFHALHAGRKPGDQLAQAARATARRAVPLTVLFRSVRPQAPVDELERFLRARLGRSPAARKLMALYQDYAPDRYSLRDRAYLANLHPLELWLVAHLHARPGATLDEVLRDGAAARREAFAWLHEAGPRAQNTRIRTMIEEDAFRRLHAGWRRLGYPFEQLVPSLASALGSSGDRPDALVALMGLLLNDGLALPAVDTEALRFGAGTPYEVEYAFVPDRPRRVLPPEVCAVVRRALRDVVSSGTAQRLRSAASPDAAPIGGKTGTSDDRRKTFDRHGNLLEERSVGRTATFVFYVGDRYFGAVSAHVAGGEAQQYSFTSALMVQLLAELLRELPATGFAGGGAGRP